MISEIKRLECFRGTVESGSRGLRFAAVIPVMLLALSACGSASTTSSTSGDACIPRHPGLTTIDPGNLTVAVYDYPPYAGVAQTTLTGAEGELITSIAALECLTVIPQSVPPAGVIASVADSTADTAIGDWSRTSARAEIVTLSDAVFVDQLALVSTTGIGSVPALSGTRIGSVDGYLWNGDLEKLVGAGAFTAYPDAASVYGALAAGTIDVVVDSFPGATATLAGSPISGAMVVVPAPDPSLPSTVKPLQSNFPTAQTNPKLTAAFNEDIQELRESGEILKVALANGLPKEATEPGANTLD